MRACMPDEDGRMLQQRCLNEEGQGQVGTNLPKIELSFSTFALVSAFG